MLSIWFELTCIFCFLMLLVENYDLRHNYPILKHEVLATSLGVMTIACFMAGILMLLS